MTYLVHATPLSYDLPTESINTVVLLFVPGVGMYSDPKTITGPWVPGRLDAEIVRCAQEIALLYMNQVIDADDMIIWGGEPTPQVLGL